MRRAFTLLEVLVAAIILTLITGSLIATFIHGKRYVLHSRNRMTAAEAGKFFLEPLQMEVRQDTWDTDVNNLKVKGYPNSVVKVDVENYTANYTITNFTGLRKVKLNLTWDDVTP